MDLISDFANPLPAIVSAEMLGLPTQDHEQLKDWSQTFAQILGNFQQNPDGIDDVLNAASDMTTYLHRALVRHSDAPVIGLLGLLTHARIDGAAHRGGGDRQHDHHDGGCAGNNHQPDRQRISDPAAPSTGA
jgi:pimeloyl-[acyl-carrier protein] synthase